MMQYRFAVHFRMSIDQVEKMDRWEFAELCAYYKLEPFGFEAEQARNANIVRMLHAIHPGRKSPLKQLAEYAVEWGKDAVYIPSAADLKTKVLGVLGLLRKG